MYRVRVKLSREDFASQMNFEWCPVVREIRHLVMLWLCACHGRLLYFVFIVQYDTIVGMQGGKVRLVTPSVMVVTWNG